MSQNEAPKLIRWMGQSRDDLREFPEDARGELGYGLRQVQCGERPRGEKPLSGDLSGVCELSAGSQNGNTYRAVYTIKLGSFLYVLHCFEKKSVKGISTPKRELDLIRKRLKDAKEEYRARQTEGE